MSTRGWWLLAAVFLVSSVPRAGAQTEFFPIGAWFPGMQGARVPPTEAEKRAWAARLDAVKAAGFNTIHGAQGRGELREPEFNQPWMDLAQDRGLKVQLGSWRQPPAWRSHSRNY